MTTGTCRVCGCTDNRPCFIGNDDEPEDVCSWIDLDRTLCSNLRCVATIPLVELENLNLAPLHS